MAENKKILIIDDSLMDRRLIISVLKKNGVENECVEASNGEEGLSVLSSQLKEIGLIFLDWQMPQMDGIEFMKGVVSVPATASIPIIMVTASSSEDNKKTAYETNPNLAGYIVKPYKAELIISTAKSFL